MKRVGRALLSLGVLAPFGCYEGGDRRLVAGDTFGDFGSESVDSSAGESPDSGGSVGPDIGDSSTSGDGDGDGSTSGDPTTSGSTTGDSTTSGSTSTSSGDTGTIPPEDGNRIARDISLTTVSINQAVEVDVGSGNTLIPVSNRNGRIIRDRDALFRARWQVQSGFSTRSLEARLTVNVGGTNTKTYFDTRTVSSTGSANPGSYNGTFRWAVDGADIQSGTTFSVGLYEIDDSYATTPLPSPPPRLPTSGSSSLGVDSGNYEVDVVLVPIRWVYGSNDRTPNLSATNIETIRRTIWERNPAASINISVRSQPVLWNNAISLSGILQTLSQTKNQDNAPDGTYYEGLADFGCFAVNGSSCSNYGTTGLGYVAPSSSWASDQRASISVWYDPQSSAETLTHELGHNQGMSHAPCGGASGSDPSFPYSGGAIGVYGHKLNSTTIYSPSSTYDYMGYCDPSWVSDWTWEQIAMRNGLFTTAAPLPSREGILMQGIIDDDGAEHWVRLEGTLPLDSITPDTFIELWSEDRIVARLPAYEHEIGENGAQVITVQLPEELEHADGLQKIVAAVLDTPDVRTPLGLNFIPHAQLQ